jgi:hypothetical protein
MMGNQICPAEPIVNQMDQNDKKVQPPNSIEEVASQGMLLTEALYEILADKGVLTGEGVIERIKKLKSEIKTNPSRPN